MVYLRETGYGSAGYRTAGHRSAGHRTAGHRTAGHRSAGHRSADQYSGTHSLQRFMMPPFFLARSVLLADSDRASISQDRL